VGKLPLYLIGEGTGQRALTYSGVCFVLPSLFLVGHISLALSKKDAYNAVCDIVAGKQALELIDPGSTSVTL
jgi:hypothetical protein